MDERRHAWTSRFGTVLALASVAASAGLLLAHAVPGSWGEPGHAGRFLFAVAFFTRTFESHAAMALLVSAAALLAMRRAWWAAFATIVPLIVLAPIAWTWVRPPPRTVQKPFKVLTANLLVGHYAVDRVSELIEREAPDVVFFQEYTPAKAERLVSRLGAMYPHRVEGLREHAFGAAIYSRLAFEGEPELFPHQEIRGHASARSTGEVGIWDPQPRAVIRHDGRAIVLQNLHFAPPIRVSYLGEQRIMTAWLCRWLATEQRPVVLAGDLNSTDASANLSDLRRAGLASVRTAGRGTMGTWPSTGWAGLAPVGIDHILIRGLRCDDARVCGQIDSDHLPLVARVEIE